MVYRFREVGLPTRVGSVYRHCRCPRATTRIAAEHFGVVKSSNNKEGLV